MILIAKKTDGSITKNKEYFCFGINILLDKGKMYVHIIRDKDGIPILEDFDSFEIKSYEEIKFWCKRFYLEGLRILIAPSDIIEFDWDLYHDGDENAEKNFLTIYKRLISKKNPLVKE